MIACLWATGVLGGTYQLLLYETNPGEAEPPPSAWPNQNNIHLVDGKFQIVLVAHPHCACSRASLGELAIIMGKFPDSVEATVLFYAPSSKDPSWIKTDLWDTAMSIPGVHAIADKDGAIAQRFNAKTSGETLLYDQEGNLTFWGGITASRAHSGDNSGRDAIVSVLSGNEPAVVHTAIFGCHLFGMTNLSMGS